MISMLDVFNCGLKINKSDRFVDNFWGDNAYADFVCYFNSEHFDWFVNDLDVHNNKTVDLLF